MMQATHGLMSNSNILEIFQRALLEHDNDAWQFIQEQYERLVQKWLYDFCETLSYGDVADLLQQTFIKFWQTLAQQAHKFIEAFQHVGQLLKYLKMCAYSIVADHQRRQVRQTRLEEQLCAAMLNESNSLTADTAAIVEQSDQAHRIWHYLIQTATYEEVLVLRMTFLQGAKPSEIAAAHPLTFDDRYHVYGIKERLVRRAQRFLTAYDPLALE